ncbi:hypothetical protein [Modicisalibacter coralii]|uniref:hypothetical protein n=1 Tax=Modicisalibacter coralii TaxID=2304602 RepID=UPI00100AD3BF|nr:hypothetical protein [Halomonas coralii]
MTNVTSLDDYRPHDSGNARCLQCGHEWHAVVPSGVKGNLECPACHFSKGEFLGNCVPPEDWEIFTCNCGNDQFYVLHGAVFCRGCGESVAFDELE